MPPSPQPHLMSMPDVDTIVAGMLASGLLTQEQSENASMRAQVKHVCSIIIWLKDAKII